MPDNKNKPGPQDSSRININEAYEVKYWTTALGISAEQLKDAVDQVGTSVRAVRAYFDK